MTSAGRGPARSARRWWWIFTACAIVVLIAPLWITTMVIRLERREFDARADAARQESIRLALWRMDSWITPRLAREASRPVFDYQPFQQHDLAYTSGLSRIQDDVLTPSPLLGFESDLFRLHFQVTPDGEVTSPQAPRGNLCSIAEQNVEAAQLVSKADMLDQLIQAIEPQQLAVHIERAMAVDKCVASIEWTENASDASAFAETDQFASELERSRNEQTRRQGTYVQNIEDAAQSQRSAAKEEQESGTIEVGALVPFWIRPAGAPQPWLLFVRQVRVAGRQYHQGFLADWEVIRSALLVEITDLFDAPQLMPIEDADQVTPTAMQLAAIPAVLQIPDRPLVQVPLLTRPRITIFTAWLAVLIGVVTVGITLRASISLAEKRSRFATTVTHELRTPLTTFRLYTEMLADGMVPEEARRAEYLQTLKEESGRLSALVENVLAYARVESGQQQLRMESVTLGDVLSAVQPPVQRRCEESGMIFSCNCEPDIDTVLRTDVDAVRQIVLNLIDNACKYASHGEAPAVELDASAHGGHIVFAVTDHGGGIPENEAPHVFSAFERGSAARTDQPGLGLGLALSRGLARDLGGDLVFQRTNHGGARFELTLPL